MNYDQLDIVRRYWPCDAGGTWWARQNSPEAAWIKCSRHDWITWYVAMHHLTDIPATMEILRLACFLVGAKPSEDLENMAMEAINLYYRTFTAAGLNDHDNSAARIAPRARISGNLEHFPYNAFVKNVTAGGHPLSNAISSGYYRCLTYGSYMCANKFMALVKSIIPLHKLRR